MTECFYKERKIWRHRDTQGRKLREARYRDQSHAGTKQGTSRISGNDQKLEEARKDSFWRLWREPGPANTLILDL